MRLVVPPGARRPDPPPVQSNERAVVWVGVGVWAVLFVVALVRREDLAAQGHLWWVWTPLIGIALGLLGQRWLRGRGR